MRTSLQLALGGLLACGDDIGEPPRYLMTDMHGLDAEAAWIWRLGDTGAVDTGRDGVLDEAALIWARHDNEGGLELRQGETWGTSDAWGGLQFDVRGGGLALKAWDLPMDAGGRLEGTGDIRMADAEAAHGDQHTSGAVRCETIVNAGVQTFFGSFEQTLTLSCTGSEAHPVGQWVFVRDLGLVQLRSPVVVDLDLVRPGW